jgi:hypothetical protein
MKNILKYLAKLLFVVILPISMLIVGVSYLMEYWGTDAISIYNPLFWMSVLIGVGTIMNAILYSAIMDKTALFSRLDISYERGLMFGLAVGYHNREIILIIPFFVINIGIVGKRK